MSNWNRLTRLACAWVAFAVLLFADQVDDIVKAEMEAQHVPGLALAVIQDGKPIRSAGYGLANVELQAAVTPRTAFKIGSVSKQFLAAGLMILVQEGKISLDDPVRKYLEDAPPAWNGITVRHLLSHTSGIIREGPAFDGLTMQPDIDVIRSAYPVALLFSPGDQWRYCNVGYFTVAQIIQRVAGEPWPQFLEHRIFGPLGLQATRTTTWQDIVPARADGYEWEDGKLRRAEEYRAVRPSGAFLSTVEDLAKWDAALYTDTPLSEATRRQMWTPVKLTSGASSHYGLGWEVQVRSGKLCLHRGGSLPGFRSHFARFPEQRLSFVVLTNGALAEPGRILFKIADLWIPGVAAAPPNGRIPGAGQ